MLRELQALRKNCRLTAWQKLDFQRPVRISRAILEVIDRIPRAPCARSRQHLFHHARNARINLQSQRVNYE
jgi:hypothetical protein